MTYFNSLTHHHHPPSIVLPPPYYDHEMTSLFYSREYLYFPISFIPIFAYFYPFLGVGNATLRAVKNLPEHRTNIASTESGPAVLLKPIDDVYRAAERPGGDTLLLPAMPAAGHVLYQASLDQEYASNAFSSQFPTLNASSQTIPAPEPDLNIQSTADAAPTGADTMTVPADNQEQIAALVNSREKEVTELQTTLAVPLAAFNAKFIWHCIMNIERDCEYVLFLLKFIPSPPFHSWTVGDNSADLLSPAEHVRWAGN